MFARIRAAAPIALGGLLALSLAAVARAQTTDPFLWLEDVNGPRAQAWVKDENAKTVAVFEKDPRFATFEEQAERINGATDRVPTPDVIDGTVYNFWQDAQHARGIWRATSVADYAKPDPNWTTVLDLDALAKAESKNWIWQGANCDSPSRKRCLISLSDGGEDASTIREFDLPSRTFVTDGFALPHGKQTAVWMADDTLLVSREWTPGELTSSGYPFDVRMLKRGQPLDAATGVYRGSATDDEVGAQELHDGSGHRLLLISRRVSFFESEKDLLLPDGAHKLDMPLESDFSSMVDGHVSVTLDKAWTANGTVFPEGALVSLDYGALVADPDHLKPTIVFAPGPRETLESSAATRDRLIVTTLQNVSGRAFSYAPNADGTWSRTPIALPDESAIAIADTDSSMPDVYLSVTNFLAPTAIYHGDAGDGAAAFTVVKAAGAKFDAAQDVVEQREATSKDGTRIPYFIVHRKNMPLDGTTPTILTAYGGFGISMTPSYSGTLGKLWLEGGGSYVLANIRGGGEFGPAWHDAGLKTHRQRIFDDFAAVGEDLVAKKFTSPRHLGIEGGSNGGLLMGVELEQHPDLWNAVFIAVPLLDMVRFEQIAAGASWVGEYGTVSKPDERAFLASISPYANIKAGTKYPKPFLFTTTKDDRVGPQHARKFAAKLSSMKIPYYFYEVVEGGHASGANIKERSFTAALTYAYFAKQLF